MAGRKTRELMVTGFVLAAIGLPGCGGPEPDAEAKKVAQWVLKAGGTLTVSGAQRRIQSPADLPSGEFAILTIDLSQRPVRDKDLTNLIGLKNLQRLGLYQTEITDKGLKYLSGLQSLTELELSYTSITDKGLAELVKLKNLQKVYLTGTAVTDEGIKKLKEALPSVTVIRL
ncbi:MAG TPA: hypothetical protein EYP14_19220 [Planctomycetaceae bacterium]|nr:hypothetical protein [Planctomycetaceae bacterium]